MPVYGGERGNVSSDPVQASAVFQGEALYVLLGKAPQSGKSLGHAGAIVSGNVGTAKTKIAALEDAGVHVVKNPVEMVETIRSLLK